MVGLTDHAAELKKIDFKNGEIEFLSPKGEEGFSEDTLFKWEGGRRSIGGYYQHS